jgi:hypothetical protein
MDQEWKGRAVTDLPPSPEAIWPYLAKYLAEAFAWAGAAPEEQTVGLYVDLIPVMCAGEIVGHIVTGEEMRFEPLPAQRR